MPDQLEKPEIKDQFIQGIITILHRDKIRICSLGEQDDIEDLWNRYGGKHTGYCVEYKMKTYSAEEPLLPVIYEYERQTNVILALVNNFISQMVTILSDGKIPVDISQYLRLFVSKYLKWEEQKEWRIIGLSKERVDAPEISKIIIGSDASEENKKQMMDFCEANGINCVVEQTNRDI